MKWDWGKGIALSFILFCGFIIWIVVQAFQQNIDLVSDTYYQDELVYQDRIDQKSNLFASGVDVSITQELDQLIFIFPKQFEQPVGEVKFYHPSRSIFDKTFELLLDNNNEQRISITDILKGKYKIQISWKAGEKDYYEEEEIFIR